MNLELRDGLLFASIQLSFRGNKRIIDNIVIDTGAAESIISPDAVEELGIFAEPEDSVNSFYGVGGSLHYFFSKNIEEIRLDKVKVKDFKMDFGVVDPKGYINGLLGLDFLLEIGAIINLKTLSIKF